MFTKRIEVWNEMSMKDLLPCLLVGLVREVKARACLVCDHLAAGDEAVRGNADLSKFMSKDKLLYYLCQGKIVFVPYHLHVT